MKGIIIGGGIGGLATAIALQQVGFETEVYEATAELKPVGAGISMAPNAMNILYRLGLGPKIEAAGTVMDSLTVTDEHFKPIQNMERGPIKERFGYAATNLHRAALHQVLLSELRAEIVHLGKRFTHAEQHGGKVTAHFEDGTTATADFLIAADGLHSKVRQQLFPEVKYRYSGQTSWRGVVQFNLPAAHKAQSIEAFGGKNRFGFTSIAPGQVYWYVAAIAPADRPVPAHEVKTNLLERFKGFHPLVNQLIAETPVEQIMQTDMYDFVTPNVWSRGHICLVGDAVHAMTPNMGQGGCQAIEDAWFLAEALLNHPEPAQAFEAFTQQRLPKVRYIVNNSWNLGKIAHLLTGRKLLYFLMRQTPMSLTMKQLEKVFGV